MSLYLFTRSRIAYQNLCMHVELLYEYVHVVLKVEVHLPCERNEGTWIFNL